MMYSDDKAAKITPWFWAIEKNLLKAPISFYLLTTDICPCRCQMCNHWKLKNPIVHEYETIHSILWECQENGSISASLTGGDIFYWPHYEKLCKDESICLDFQVTTPLILPKNYNYELIRRIKWLRVSIDAISEEGYKKVRGINGRENVKYNLRKVMQEKLCDDVGVATTLQRDSLPELKEIAELCIELGIKRWIVHPVMFSPNLEISPNEYFDIYSDLKAKYGNALPINNFDVFVEKKFETLDIPCKVPLFTCFIDTKFRVWPCCILAMDSRGDGEHLEELSLGRFSKEGNAGKNFLKLWNEKKYIFDKFENFKDIHPLCAKLCFFKYYYSNVGFYNCKNFLGSFYL